MEQWDEKNFALSKLENEKRQGKDGAGYVHSLTEIEIEISLCVSMAAAANYFIELKLFSNE